MYMAARLPSPSYCSYALRKYESAGKVALNAGNNEVTLIHYLSKQHQGRGRGVLKHLP